MKKIALGFFLVFFALALHAEENSIKSVTLTGSIINDACASMNNCHGFVSTDYKAYDESGNLVGQGRSDENEWGTYKVEGIVPGKEYKFVITDTAYLYREYFVKIPKTEKYDSYSRDFLVVPKKSGLELLVHVPPFELRKTKLRVGAGQILEEFERLIILNPSLKIEISCFSDDDSDEEYNFELTYGRCLALKDYLISKGIDESRLKVMPVPETDPAIPPPGRKNAKGKRYIGSTYLIIREI